MQCNIAKRERRERQRKRQIIPIILNMFRSERRILLLFAILSIAEASLYVTDLQMNRMIELTIRKPHCRIHTDRGTIQHIVLSMDQLKVSFFS